MRGRPPLILFRTIAASPRAWKRFRGGSLLDDSLFDPREREIIINRACARAACEYEWGVHVVAFAKAASLSRADIEATLAPPGATGHWSPREQVLVDTIDALHDDCTLSPAQFEALRSHLADDQIFEILMLAGFYRMVAYISRALDLPLEETAARFAEYAA